MASTIPYIGSKISLISNSDIRYEGILYTINTQESTIALQTVRTFGTEGRKVPEIPPSSEVYDFIIFRGQDIKDLTVLEGYQKSELPDPAIMSVSQSWPGSPGKDEAKGSGKATPSRGTASNEKGGWGHAYKGNSNGGADYHKGSGRTDGWAKGGGRWDDVGRGKGKWEDSGKGKWEDNGKGKWEDSGKGSSSYSKGGGKTKAFQAAEKGGKAKGKSFKGGKDDGKGAGAKGKAKGAEMGAYGKANGKGNSGTRRPGGIAGATNGGITAAGVPVGELLPEENAAVKRECAEEFDVAASNTKFDKVTIEILNENAVEDQQKPRSGYDKGKSFFDNISCEATDRASDDRQKVDRDKARQYDRETFGDTRRPPRPIGVRRGKGKSKGASNGTYRTYQS